MRLPGFIERRINDRFGSKRGLVRWLQARMQMMLGRYERHRAVDFGRVERLVFVCSGNICRSPFGEYYARAKGMPADSCGLHTRGGDPADPRAIEFAAGIGIDMGGHRTRHIRDYRPRAGDLVLVMEPGQFEELEACRQRDGWPSSVQSSILPLFKASPSPYLHDPFAASPAFFRYCERQVMDAVDGLIERVQQATARKAADPKS